MEGGGVDRGKTLRGGSGGIGGTPPGGGPSSAKSLKGARRDFHCSEVGNGL